MRNIDDILSDLIAKATPLSPYPDGYKNYIVGQEFIYEIQGYLDSTSKQGEKNVSDESKFCTECIFIFRI